MTSILVTGSAGFIGFHVSKRLLAEGFRVTGLDNLNDYYDVNLKQARLEQLTANSSFRFVKANLADRAEVKRVFENEGQAKTEPGLPLRLYNVGNNSPVTLLDFIKVLEEATGKKAKLNFLPLQPGDVPATWADVDGLACDVGFRPQTPLREGLRRFVDWYREFYGV